MSEEIENTRWSQGAPTEVQLREKRLGEKALEFGLDTTEVVGTGVIQGFHGTARLIQAGVNVMAKAPSPHMGIPSLIQQEYTPVETRPMLDIVPEDLRSMLAEKGMDMSDDKWQLAHAVSMMTSAIGISSKLNAMLSVDDIASLSHRVGTKIGTGIAGDIGANLITPDGTKGNILSVFGAEESGALGWLVTDYEEDESKRRLKNMVVDAGIGLGAQTVMESMLFLKKAIGSSTKSATFRAQFASDVVNDPLYINLKEFVNDTVEGASLVAHTQLNPSKLDFSVKPISDAEVHYKPTTVQQVEAKMLRDEGNIQLKSDKKVKLINQEANNQLRHTEDTKRVALDDLNKQKVELEAEIHAQNKALQGDAPKPDQKGLSAKNSRARYRKQVQAFDEKAGKQLDAMNARIAKVVAEAEHEAKAIGDTQLARLEAEGMNLQSQLDTNAERYGAKKAKVQQQKEQAEVLEDIDDSIHKREVSDEEVEAVHDAGKPLDSKPLTDTTTEAKRQANKIIKKRKDKIKEGIENHVVNLRRELADDASKLSPEEKILAEKFVTKFGDGSVDIDSIGKQKGHISTKTEALDDVTHVLNYFDETLKGTKKTVNGVQNLQYINKVLNEGVTDEFSKAIKELSHVTGLDRETLLINANSWGVVLEEATPLVTAFRLHLDKAMQEFHKEIKAVSKRLKRAGLESGDVSATELENILHLKGVIEGLHEGLGGVKSALGRGLKASGSAYGSAKFADPLEQVRKNLNLKKPSKQAIKNDKQKESILNQAMKSLTVKDQKSLQRFIHDMAKMDTKELTAKLVTEASAIPAFNELLLTNGMLGLIAKPSVLAGVFTSTLLQYGWDQLVTKNLEALMSTIVRGVGGVDTGIRFDNMARLKANFDVLKDYLRYWQGDKTALGSIGTEVTDYASRATTQTLDDINASIKEAIGLRKGEEYDSMSSKAITFLEDKILRKPLGYSMYLNSKPVRGMEMADGLFRRLSIASELESQATIMFNTKGGKAFFGDHLSQDVFTKRFKEKGARYMKLEDSLNHKEISQLEFTDKVTDLFKGDEKLLDSIKEATLSSETRAVRTTFQESTEDTVAGNLLRAFNQFSAGEGYSKMALRFVGAMIVPFQKSPVNAVRAVAEHSPLAFTSLRFWETLKHGTPADKMNTIAKMVGGTALMGGIYTQVMEGTITGSVPKGEFGKTVAEQKPPYSIRVGDTWWSYERWGLLKTLLATSADAITHSSTDPESTNLSLMGLGFNAMVADSQIQGIQDVIEAGRHQDPARFMESMARKGISLIEPARGITATVNEIVFPIQVESTIAKEATALSDMVYRTLANSSKSGVAGGILQATDHFNITNVYDEKLDTIGAPMRRYEDNVTSKLLHFAGQKTTTIDSGLFRNQLLEYGVIKDTMSPVDVYDTKLNSVQAKKYNRELFRGTDEHQGLLSELKQLMQTTQFQSRSPKTKQQVVDKVVSRHKRELQMRMYKSDADIRSQHATTKQDKFKEATRSVDLEDLAEGVRHRYTTGSPDTRKRIEQEAKQTAEAFELSK